MLDALRPEPHRGDTVAAGVVALTVGLLLVSLRFDSEWHAGVHVLLLLPAAAAVFLMGALSPREDVKPRPYQSALYVCSYALALVTLLRLADLLGGDEVGSGTIVWTGLLLCALAAWFAVARGSAVMTLVALVTAGVVWVAFWDWVAEPGLGAVRWLLLLLTIAFVLGAVGQRDRRPEHGVGFADAAGLAVLAIAATFLVQAAFAVFVDVFDDSEPFAPSGAEIGAGWELVILAAGFGLCAYGAVDRWRGPVYLGVANLAAFLVLASLGETSLLFWPLLLLGGAAALLVVGLRPARPLPPPPDEHRPPASAQPLPTQAPPPPPPPDEPPTTPLWGGGRE